MHNFDIKCIIYISDKSQLYLLFTRIIGDEGAGQREGRERKQHKRREGDEKDVIDKLYWPEQHRNAD